MSKRFIVRTAANTKSVQIAFTLTPAETESVSNPKAYPVAYHIMNFTENITKEQKFEWFYDLGFSVWTRKTTRAIKADKKHRKVPPTHHVELIQRQGSPQLQWSRSLSYHENLVVLKERMVVATNGTNESQNITLGCLQQSSDPEELSFYDFRPMVCYRLSSGFSLCVPSSLVLQAYVVDIGDKRNQRLLAEDLEHPLFEEAIICDNLPTSSRWELSQDSAGVLRLQNQGNELVDLQTAEAQIDELRQLLNQTCALTMEIRCRILAAEESIKRIQGCYPTCPTTP